MPGPYLFFVVAADRGPVPGQSSARVEVEPRLEVRAPDALREGDTSEVIAKARTDCCGGDAPRFSLAVGGVAAGGATRVVGLEQVAASWRVSAGVGAGAAVVDASLRDAQAEVARGQRLLAILPTAPAGPWVAGRALDEIVQFALPARSGTARVSLSASMDGELLGLLSRLRTTAPLGSSWAGAVIDALRRGGRDRWSEPRAVERLLRAVAAGDVDRLGAGPLPARHRAVSHDVFVTLEDEDGGLGPPDRWEPGRSLLEWSETLDRWSRRPMRGVAPPALSWPPPDENDVLTTAARAAIAGGAGDVAAAVAGARALLARGRATAAGLALAPEAARGSAEIEAVSHAVALLVAARFRPEDPRLGEAARWLRARVRRGQYDTPLAAVWAALALRELGAGGGSDDEPATATLCARGRCSPAMTLRRDDPPVVLRVPVDGLERALSLTARGGVSFHVELEAKEPPAEPAGDVVRIRRTHEGADDAGDVRAVEGRVRVRQGTYLRVRLRIDLAEPVAGLTVVDDTPLGLTPVEVAREVHENGEGDEPLRWEWEVPAADGRTSVLPRQAVLETGRATFGLGPLPAGRYELTYLARADVRGSFTAPPARAIARRAPRAGARRRGQGRRRVGRPARPRPHLTHSMTALATSRGTLRRVGGIGPAAVRVLGAPRRWSVDIGTRLKERGAELLRDPRVMKAMQDERVQRMIMQAFRTRGELQSRFDARVEGVARALNFATKKEVRDLKRTLRKMERRLDRAEKEAASARKAAAG